MDINKYVTELYSFLKKNSNAEIAEKQSKYMRYRFPFIGLMNQERRDLWKEFQLENGKIPKEKSVDFAKACIKYSEREMWYIAAEVLKSNKKYLLPEDLDFIRKMLVASDWWDIVDTLASHNVGTLCLLYPELRPDVNAWIANDNFWLRRTSIIYQLGYKTKTDEKVLYRNIKQTMHEKEFFIRKAIGWALREYAKTNPLSVRSFIDENKNKLSPLSIKEGSKYL